MTIKQAQYLQTALASRDITLTLETLNTLWKAQRTLHRWAEAECGTSTPYASFSIERDPDTNKPYRVVYPYNRPDPIRTRIPDLETSTLKRIQSICQAHNLHYYHQGDPRGCMLYLSKEPLTDSNYTNGVAILG